MDRNEMEKLIKESGREEFEAAIDKMEDEVLDELLFELRLRLSNIRSKIITTQVNRKLAELEHNQEEVKTLLKRLSSLYSAEGWLRAKEKIANRALEKRVGPASQRFLEAVTAQEVEGQV